MANGARVEIPAGVSVDGAADASVVACCERLLAMARSGQMRALAVCYSFGPSHVTLDGSTGPLALEINVGIDLLKRKIVDGLTAVALQSRIVPGRFTSPGLAGLGG